MLRFQEVTVDNGWDGSGYTTYKVSIVPNADLHAKSCYSIFGEKGHEMLVPAARQVPAPFGQDVGGVNPAFWALPGHEDCKYDSWLTVGVQDGNPNNEISSIGIDFASWSVVNTLSVDDGAVFWMNPDNAFDGRAVVAQLTIPDTTHSSKRKFKFSAQGRMAQPATAGDDALGNWKTLDMHVQLGGRDIQPPTNCDGEWGAWGACNVCGDHGRKTRSYRVTQPAVNGGIPCMFKNAATQSTACKPDERPCAPAVVPHNTISCHATSKKVTTTLSSNGKGARAIFDFVLDSRQSVTIRNQLPKDCPTLSLFNGFEGSNTSATPLIRDHAYASCGRYDPLQITLDAGSYAVVADTALRRSSGVQLVTMCREPVDGGSTGDNPTNPSPRPDLHRHEVDTHADGNANRTRKWFPVVLVICFLVLLIVGCGYLCVMKRANGTLASKRRQDLDAQLDYGLDADFGDQLRFSTQDVQSIRGSRGVHAE